MIICTSSFYNSKIADIRNVSTKFVFFKQIPNVGHLDFFENKIKFVLHLILYIKKLIFLNNIQNSLPAHLSKDIDFRLSTISVCQHHNDQTERLKVEFRKTV